MTLKFCLIILLIVFSAFFSSTETAFSSLNVIRLKQSNEEKKSRRKALALKLNESFENLIATILIGNSLVNTAASSIATVIVITLLGENLSFLSTVIMTAVILIFGEITPKIIGKNDPERTAVFAAYPIYALYILFTPVVFLAQKFVLLISLIWKENVTNSESYNEDDLESIIDIAEDEGVIDEEKSDLLQNVLDFGDVCAYEIITPRVDMLSIDVHDPVDKNINILLDSPYSRIPVYEDTLDKIIGILHLNTFYKELAKSEEVSIRNLLIEPVFIYKTMPLFDVLKKMQENKCHMVVVLDEYGGTMGILTMEDILEQIVGDIWDESDEVIEEFTRIDETHFEASGDMRLQDFFDEFSAEVDNEEFDGENVTVGGFAMEQLGGEAEKGSEFTFKNLKITVIEYDNFRIDRVAVEVTENETEDREE